MVEIITLAEKMIGSNILFSICYRFPSPWLTSQKLKDDYAVV
ncbi:MAG: hypothetical protein V4685_13885 [Bacteroidota bacterium]